MSRVSVVMPVYNSGRYLSQAIESILNQTYRDFEFVIVDRASTDTGPKIIRRYLRKDTRIHYMRLSRRIGYIGQLNRGVGCAVGEYIARMDADDISLPNRLALQVDFLDRHPKVAALGGAVACIDANGVFTGVVGTLPSSKEAIRRSLLLWSPLAHPTVMMRKSAFEAVGGYRRAFELAEDYDLWLRMAERFELANLPTCLLYHRVHPGQVSSRRKEQQMIAYLATRAAAEVRRVKGYDPFNKHSSQVTCKTLVALSATSNQVMEVIIEGTLRLAALRLHEGEKMTARRLFEAVCAKDPKALTSFAVMCGLSYQADGTVFRQFVQREQNLRRAIGAYNLGCGWFFVNRGKICTGVKLVVSGFSTDLGLVPLAIFWVFHRVLSRRF